MHLVKRNCSSHGFVASDLLVPANQMCNNENQFPVDINENVTINGNKRCASDLDLNLGNGNNYWHTVFE